MHDASVIPNHHITNGPAMRENEPIIRSVRPEPIEKRFALRNWNVNDIAVAPTTEEQRFALRQRVDADQRVTGTRCLRNVLCRCDALPETARARVSHIVDRNPVANLLQQIRREAFVGRVHIAEARIAAGRQISSA